MFFFFFSSERKILGERFDIGETCGGMESPRDEAAWTGLYAALARAANHSRLISACSALTRSETTTTGTTTTSTTTPMLTTIRGTSYSHTIE